MNDFTSTRAAPGLGATLASLWSSTRFSAPELADYATGHIERDTRQGLALLALAALLFLLQGAGFASWFALGWAYTYTFCLLAALALHIFLSARQVREVQALNLLAMVLLIVSASALALVARALRVRKHDLAARFRLERSRAGMATLAERDHLTGARNRRFLEREFEYQAKRAGGAGIRCGALVAEVAP